MFIINYYDSTFAFKSIKLIPSSFFDLAPGIIAIKHMIKSHLKIRINENS